MACLENLVLDRSNRLQLAVRSSGFAQITRLLERYAQKVDDCFAALGTALSHAKEIGQKEFERWVGKLEALSPLAVLGRGYSMTFVEASGHLLKKSHAVKVGEMLKTRLGEGSVVSTVVKVE